MVSCAESFERNEIELIMLRNLVDTAIDLWIKETTETVHTGGYAHPNAIKMSR